MSEAADNSEVIRAGAHTDYGSVTLLFVEADGVGGLQVDLAHMSSNESESESGRVTPWTDVPAKEGMVICNVADAIEFWTGGRYRSTVHRVALPLTEAQAGARFSMYAIATVPHARAPDWPDFRSAYFCQPDDEAPLCPLGKNGDPVPLEEDQWKSTSRAFNAKFAGIPKDTPTTGGGYLQARLNATYDHRRQAASADKQHTSTMMHGV